MAKVPHSAKWLEIKTVLESAFSMSEPIERKVCIYIHYFD